MEKQGLAKPILIGMMALVALLYVVPTMVGPDVLPGWYENVFSILATKLERRPIILQASLVVEKRHFFSKCGQTRIFVFR